MEKLIILGIIKIVQQLGYFFEKAAINAKSNQHKSRKSSTKI
jgi:hypothetical protein